MYLFEKIKEDNPKDLIIVHIKYKHCDNKKKNFLDSTKQIKIPIDNWQYTLNKFLIKFDKIKNDINILNSNKHKGIAKHITDICVDGTNLTIPLQFDPLKNRRIPAVMDIEKIEYYDDNGDKFLLSISTIKDKFKNF